MDQATLHEIVRPDPFVTGYVGVELPPGYASLSKHSLENRTRPRAVRACAETQRPLRAGTGRGPRGKLAPLVPKAVEATPNTKATITARVTLGSVGESIQPRVWMSPDRTESP
jgi:hypothetical protein